MTFIRLDTGFPEHEIIGELAEALHVHVDRAGMSLIRAWCKFGDYQQDGMATSISDTTLEKWAGWSGRRGRFATAFRDRCVEPGGRLKGWWRNEALLRHQEKKRMRPGPKRRKPGAGSGKNPAEIRQKTGAASGIDPAPEKRRNHAGNDLNYSTPSTEKDLFPKNGMPDPAPDSEHAPPAAHRGRSGATDSSATDLERRKQQWRDSLKDES